MTLILFRYIGPSDKLSICAISCLITVEILVAVDCQLLLAHHNFHRKASRTVMLVSKGC